MLLGCEGAILAPGEPPGGPEAPGLPARPDGPAATTPPVDVCEPSRVSLSPVTVRRLNRAEYDATVRDLLGDRTGSSRDLPADDFGHGFDNQGDALFTAPLLVEKYDAAALKLVQTGLANRPARLDGPGDHASGTGAFLTVAHPFKTNGSNIRNGISFDQVLANAWRGQTRFASLELGIDGSGSTGD
jgi:hypothetical protein